MSRQERREGFRSSGIALAVLAAIAVVAWLSTLAADAFGRPQLSPFFAGLTVAAIATGLIWSGRRGSR